LALRWRSDRSPSGCRDGGRKTAWVAAVACPLLLTLGQRALSSSVPPATTLFVILLVVVVVALLGGVRPALAATLTGLIAQEVLFEFPYGSLNNHEPAQVSVLVVFVVIGAGIGILVDELARLHTEQAALRRLAALVARGVRPAELFSAVANEVASLLDVDSALVARLDPDGVLTILAAGAVTPTNSTWASACKLSRRRPWRRSGAPVDRHAPTTTIRPLRT